MWCLASRYMAPTVAAATGIAYWEMASMMFSMVVEDQEESRVEVWRGIWTWGIFEGRLDVVWEIPTQNASPRHRQRNTAIKPGHVQRN